MLCLLYLQEKRIIFIIAGEKNYPATGTYAANSYNLTGNIYNTIVFQQVLPVIGKGLKVSI